MYSVLDVVELHHDQPPYRRPRDALWDLSDEEDDVICESGIWEFSRPSDEEQTWKIYVNTFYFSIIAYLGIIMQETFTELIIDQVLNISFCDRIHDDNHDHFI
jgi:hypothetical protein